MVSVLLADDHVLFRETVAEYLERDSETSFKIDQVDNFHQASECLASKCYEIVILDWHMEGLGHIEKLQSILSGFPLQKFIIISGMMSEPMIRDIHDTNIHAFLPKTMAGKDFVEAIKRVLDGDIIKHDGPSYTVDKDDERLTAREKMVLSDIKEGLSNKEISSSLNISEVTVKKHVKHILEKYNCATRTQLLARWINS